MRRRIQLREVQAQALVPGLLAAVDGDAGGGRPLLIGERHVDPRARVAQPHERFEFGSSTTTRRRVRSISCSSTAPSAYVLPDPDWPQKNVWRSKPRASIA
ncbi:MAG: hypothetical protein R2736_09460 [Solirubrobacterales bacterium]